MFASKNILLTSLIVALLSPFSAIAKVTAYQIDPDSSKIAVVCGANQTELNAFTKTVNINRVGVSSWMKRPNCAAIKILDERSAYSVREALDGVEFVTEKGEVPGWLYYSPYFLINELHPAVFLDAVGKKDSKVLVSTGFLRVFSLMASAGVDAKQGFEGVVAVDQDPLIIQAHDKHAELIEYLTSDKGYLEQKDKLGKIFSLNKNEAIRYARLAYLALMFGISIEDYLEFVEYGRKEYHANSLADGHECFGCPGNETNHILAMGDQIPSSQKMTSKETFSQYGKAGEIAFELHEMSGFRLLESLPRTFSEMLRITLEISKNKRGNLSVDLLVRNLKPLFWYQDDTFGKIAEYIHNGRFKLVEGDFGSLETHRAIHVAAATMGEGLEIGAYDFSNIVSDDEVSKPFLLAHPQKVKNLIEGIQLSVPKDGYDQVTVISSTVVSAKGFISQFGYSSTKLADFFDYLGRHAASVDVSK